MQHVVHVSTRMYYIMTNGYVKSWPMLLYRKTQKHLE